MRIRSMMGRRTTTKMVNNSRRKAGIPTNRKTSRNSLVNYLQKDGLGISSRLVAKNANSIQSNITERSNAAKLQSSSSLLQQQTQLLGEKVDQGSSTITSTATSVVDKFNETMKNLRNSSGALNDYYLQSMKEIAVTNKKALAEIGITVGADGSLALDKDKFESVEGEKIKALLGSEGVFVKRVGIVASRVADNATASVESASSRYNSSGNLSNSYLSKYNYRG